MIIFINFETDVKLKIYQVDAFARRAFEGNPAAVCHLGAWLPDSLLQSIAAENNLSETAFFVADGDRFSLRWFTPTTEVDLCGHATLASAFVLFECEGYQRDRVHFDSRSGELSVSRDGDLLVLDFPAQPPQTSAVPEGISAAFGAEPVECLEGADIIAVYEDEEFVKSLSPDIEKLRGVGSRGVIVTAASEEYDFVARFFGPNVGIDEDPVTGSAYTQLAPYWATKTGKTRFRAKQVSHRGGELSCELAGDRVLIAGRAAKYFEGLIEIADSLLETS